MFPSLKLALAALTVGSGLIVTGCASTPPQSTVVTSPEAIATCTKCQVTLVKIEDKNQKGRVIGYHWGQKDVCPDCMDAVTSFVNTGKFEHNCKTCGDTMVPCVKNEAK